MPTSHATVIERASRSDITCHNRSRHHGSRVGSYGVLAGIEIGRGHRTMNGRQNRVTRDRFDRPSTPEIEMSGGTHACNRIDHNEIHDHHVGARRR